MGGKKKGGGGKKKAAAGVPEEDDSVEKFWKFYKKKCGPDQFDVPVSPIIKEKIDLFLDEQEIPTKFHIWMELGWAGTRAIMDALKEVK
jgi:hypothetical protein